MFSPLLKPQSLALAAALLSLLPVSALANEYPILRVNVERFSGFSTAERAKAESAMDVIEVVINSDEFRSRVLNYTHKDPSTGIIKQEFVNNVVGGVTLSNAQILEKIYAASENFRREENAQIDLNITIYTSSWFQRGTIGYTYPDADTIWVNRRHYKNFKPSQIAANFTHEWLHKVGFGHDFKATARRPFSVPYAIGNIMGQLGAAQTK